MAFDVSRFTFDPSKDYSGVVMEQGRVQTDADWNEWLAEFSRRLQAGTLDLMGRSAVPATTPDAFRITIPSAGGAISIGCGRMYVDGLLVENHGSVAAAQWDPALAELSGSPQPPPATGEFIDYSSQPYLPGATLTGLAAGQYLAYLDVWLRPITYLQDDTLVDKAIGVDTSGRVQTAWQVKLMPVPQGITWTCSTPDSTIFPAPSAGRLDTNVVPNATAGPCCLTTGSGYTGVENQLYRVEIHNPGSPSDPANAKGATFKWSRENASVATLVTNIAPATNSLNAPAFQLTVTSLGRDQVLGFAPGNWIELIDDALELGGGPGEMYQIDSVDFSAKTITLTTQLQSSSHFIYAPPATNMHTRILRWDQSGVVYEADGKTVWWDLGQPGSGGTIPVPASDTTLILESGVVVTFSLASPTGQFNSGDFWSFAARTADGTVDVLHAALPFGAHHHCTKLSILTWPSGPAPDCRNPWPPGGEGCRCCGVTVGKDAQFTSIQLAIDSLPPTGGEVSILPGRYFEYIHVANRTDIVIKGCGAQTRIASPALQSGGAGSAVPEPTASGLSAVVTILGSTNVELRDLCVEAADGECGVLLDSPQVAIEVAVQKAAALGNADVRLAELAIMASTRPAILVNEAEQVEIVSNRIAMRNVFSQWAAVYLSGLEIRFRQNWVGLLSAANSAKWLPVEMAQDLAGLTTTKGAPGGVQIAGGSKDIFIVENEIEGGSGNGVTLGSVTLLDANGGDSGVLAGAVLTEQDDCATTVTNQFPTTVPSGQTSLTVVAGDLLANITIARNRIRNMGLCGIGPVGVFDLAKVLEVISLTNVSIVGNTIERTLQLSLASNGVGYGAIFIPDVVGLRIFDNAITDFGSSPGAPEAWGIVLLLAELAEISRNRVQETRDWTLASSGDGVPASDRGGILVYGIGPPSFTSTASDALWAKAQPAAATENFVAAAVAPIFEPGIPALRVESNVVRVAVGRALEVLGFGPFSILGNHLGTGGTIPISGSLTGMTVLLLNLGTPIEFDLAANGFSGVASSQQTSAPAMGPKALAASTNGTVLFCNNICQLEARASGQRGTTSVLVATLDHLLFANNQCWLDSVGSDRKNDVLDAILFGVTIQATSNRFQESPNSVLASAATLGFMNVTSLNISTYQVAPIALVSSKLGPTDNVSWV
jgi:hypothetical protein